MLAPLLRWRKMAFLAGCWRWVRTYYFRHIVPTWDLAYMGVAILFVLLPGSNRVRSSGGRGRGESEERGPVTGEQRRDVAQTQKAALR